jgi:hypothetical protein
MDTATVSFIIVSRIPDLGSNVVPQSRRTANVSKIYGCVLEVEGKWCTMSLSVVMFIL